jgi:MEKHLA domain
VPQGKDSSWLYVEALSDYRGIRVAKSGRRFLIEDGVIWELIDEKGIRHGAAATFPSWRNI